MENDFLEKITLIIKENLADEKFGVSELAGAIGMSRSNLLRNVQKLTKLSASQYIRQVRLEKAMEMLKESSLNVSEVSFRVGFGSTSYFIKCFRDFYGYPPGEVGRKDDTGTGTSRSHQLAAIMFTDIQGYTAMMQRDEQHAIKLRKRHREIFRTTTGKFNGRILQYYGDGTLSTFSSAIDAVRCGMEMQLLFLGEPEIPVRIGIHTGDILVSRDEIIGDGVNVASRIESLAVPGSVFISEKVYDEVKNKPDILTRSIGIYQLKNVEKPVEVFAITNEGLKVPAGSKMPEEAKGEEHTGKEVMRPGNSRITLKWALGMAVTVLAAYLIFQLVYPGSVPEENVTLSEKSIAVLPFINDSNDSSNIYIINGLMEAVLNNLQKIEDLRVISRTSVEKFRNNPKTIPEIADELNVNYFVEGSGQKIGDQILLNIQLIDARSDKHLWSRQYNRETGEIFKLQSEVARNIADEIEVFITPDVAARMNQVPTDNLVAYDYFLKGQDFFFRGNREGLEDAIIWFKKAIEQDEEFALAYADIAISYYFLDLFQIDKKYTDELNYYSDKAMLYDSHLAQSITAKALYYLQAGDHQLAANYLEKALEYNPNSAFVLNILSDFYTSYEPNTAKYLEYALKGIRLNISAHDSTDAGYIYLHVSNAFIQTGFIAEAEKYVNKSLAYDPENLFSALVKVYIAYARNRDLSQTRSMLVETLEKDPTRLDIMQETGKLCYYMQDYDSAYYYYRKFNAIREQLNLDIFTYENAKIAFVLAKMGQKEESEKYLEEYKEYADHDNSIYQHVNRAMYYAFLDEREKALEEFEQFSEEENFFYWIILFLKIDPLLDNIVNTPEFERIFKKLESNFWGTHEEIRQSLLDEGLI